MKGQFVSLPAETICATVEDYSADFSSLQNEYSLYLLKELERLVSVEYIKGIVIYKMDKCKNINSPVSAIISKRLKFNPNPYENEVERKEVADQISTEADYMKGFFQKLSNSREGLAFDAIKSLADLIKDWFGYNSINVKFFITILLRIRPCRHGVNSVLCR